ncbi:MAG: hypothetical protein N3B21_16625 [Clostridia bacterium]|nr:hypothetical protein [Clostridia bacterium]
MFGGIFIVENSNTESFTGKVDQLETLEKEICNLPMIFAEMFKDEINANDEQRLYNGVKRVVKKYSQDKSAISIINEFTSVISGGASLEEILQITMDEAVNPSITSELVVDNSCKTDKH